MTTLKTLTIGTALFVGGVALAIAQGPPTGGYPPVAGGAAGNPAAPGIATDMRRNDSVAPKGATPNPRFARACGAYCR